MNDTPKYKSIHRDLQESILSGALGTGAYLPTEKELCEKFEVSRITAKHALDLLARDGLISRIKGKGSVVIYDKGSALHPKQRERGNMIGIIFSDFNEAYGIRVLYGIEEACRKNGLFPVLRLTHSNIDAEQEAIDELLNLDVSGLIIIPVNSEYYNPGILHLLLGNFPVVILDRQMKGLNACFVGTDNYASTQLAMDHLFSLGHRSIAWVSSPTAQMSTLEEREAAFQDTLIKKGIIVNKDMWYQDITARPPTDQSAIEDDLGKLANHFLAHKEITAVFASEYSVALFVKQAANLIGRRVPDDLSLVCFDSPGSWYGQSEFTYLRQREQKIGKQAVMLLLSQLREPSNTSKDTFMFPAQLIIGQSTGRAKQSVML